MTPFFATGGGVRQAIEVLESAKSDINQLLESLSDALSDASSKVYVRLSDVDEAIANACSEPWTSATQSANKAISSGADGALREIDRRISQLESAL